MSVQRRVVIATVLAVVGAVFFGVAGAGHAYLREWRRALGWFVGVLAASVLLALAFVNPETLSDPMAVGLDTLPREVTLPTIGLLALSTVDAYYVARRQTAAGQSGSARTGAGAATETGGDASDEASCPHCGKPVDRELDFCHWCTEPLDGTPEE